MTLLLNILWLVFGGLVTAVGWFFVAILCAVSIVGLPWARSAFTIGQLTLWPFGQTAVSRDELTGHEDLGTGLAGVIGNVVWLLVAGWWLALAHVTLAIIQACTIILVPFAWQHLKLAGLALWPIGKTVVPNDVARLAHDYAGWQRAAGPWR